MTETATQHPFDGCLDPEGGEKPAVPPPPIEVPVVGLMDRPPTSCVLGFYVRIRPKACAIFPAE